MAFAQQLSLFKMPQWVSSPANDVATFDRSYLLLAMAMYAIGLVMVMSSSMPVAERLFDNPFHFFSTAAAP